MSVKIIDTIKPMSPGVPVVESTDVVTASGETLEEQLATLAKSEDVAIAVSELANDAGYITNETIDLNKVKNTVGINGTKIDLSDFPAIPVYAGGTTLSFPNPVKLKAVLSTTESDYFKDSDYKEYSGSNIQIPSTTNGQLLDYIIYNLVTSDSNVRSNITSISSSTTLPTQQGAAVILSGDDYKVFKTNSSYSVGQEAPFTSNCIGGFGKRKYNGQRIVGNIYVGAEETSANVLAMCLHGGTYTVKSSNNKPFAVAYSKRYYSINKIYPSNVSAYHYHFGFVQSVDGSERTFEVLNSDEIIYILCENNSDYSSVVVTGGEESSEITIPVSISNTNASATETVSFTLASPMREDVDYIRYSNKEIVHVFDFQQIEQDAETTIQSDWNENDEDDDAYIKNKPFKTLDSESFEVDNGVLKTKAKPTTISNINQDCQIIICGGSSVIQDESSEEV